MRRNRENSVSNSFWDSWPALAGALTLALTHDVDVLVVVRLVVVRFAIFRVTVVVVAVFGCLLWFLHAFL